MNAHARPTADAPDALPEWRLDDLFSGRDDPRIEQTFDDAAAAGDALVKLKGAFVAARGDPERLGLLLAEGVGLYEKGTNSLWAIEAYASLSASVARDDPAWAKFEADVRGRSAAIGAESLFFTLELNQLEEWEIEAAARGQSGRRALSALAAPGPAQSTARADRRSGAHPDRPRACRRQLEPAVRRDPGPAGGPLRPRAADPARGPEPPVRSRSAPAQDRRRRLGDRAGGTHAGARPQPQHHRPGKAGRGPLAQVHHARRLAPPGQ